MSCSKECSFRIFPAIEYVRYLPYSLPVQSMLRDNEASKSSIMSKACSIEVYFASAEDYSI